MSEPTRVGCLVYRFLQVPLDTSRSPGNDLSVERLFSRGVARSNTYNILLSG